LLIFNLHWKGFSEISAKSLTIYFQNMMHDGIRLAWNTARSESVDLVCVKGAALRVLRAGTVLCTYSVARTLSSDQDCKCGYLDRACVFDRRGAQKFYYDGPKIKLD